MTAEIFDYFKEKEKREPVFNPVAYRDQILGTDELPEPDPILILENEVAELEQKIAQYDQLVRDFEEVLNRDV